MEGLDEPVHLAAWDAAWTWQAADEIARLTPVLGHVEHIGSTAVPGLTSKPVIDLMAIDPGGNIATTLGYEDLGEAGVPGRRYLRRRNPHFNLPLILPGSPHWTSNLALRDYLRAHPNEARRYAEAKQAAAQFPTLLAYSEHKRTVVEDLLRRALSRQQS